MASSSSSSSSSTADLDALLRTDVRHAIPAETLLPILSSPPFIPSQSLINARDLGAVPGSNIPPGLIFRSGALDRAAHDPAALAWLAAGVRRIFDLRRRPERDHAPDPLVPGVENVWLGDDGQGQEEYPTPSLDDFARADGRDAWRRQYLAVALIYRPTYRAVLEHIRDRPTEPILFHCTAGRDRTGVLAALLHHLADTPADDALRDYMLSRAGTEMARDALLRFAMASVGVADPETPGFWNLVDLRPEYWAAFLEGLRERFGGWDGYVTEALGFSAEDLGVMKRNIRRA